MKSSPLALYTTANFDRGAKATWLLTELGVSFESKRMKREDRDSEAYLKLNPMGRVPVLTINEAPIFESGAILAYLADQYGAGKLAPTLDSALRPEYLQWMFFAHSLDTFQTRIMVVEDIPAGEVQVAKQTALQSDVQDHLTALDRTLSQNKFLVGNSFSAADINVSYHLYWLRMWPELDSVVTQFPSVVSYLERLQKMPSAIKADVFSYSG